MPAPLGTGALRPDCPGTAPIGKPQGTPARGETRQPACRLLPLSTLASTADATLLFRAWHQKDCPRARTRRALNPDGTLAIGTPEQMRPLMEQWKRWQEMYARGEWPDEPVLALSRLWRGSKQVHHVSRSISLAMCRSRNES